MTTDLLETNKKTTVTAEHEKMPDCSICTVKDPGTYSDSLAKGPWVFMFSQFLKGEEEDFDKFRVMAFNPYTGKCLPFLTFLPQAIRGDVSCLLGKNFERAIHGTSRHPRPISDLYMVCGGSLVACAVHDGKYENKRLVLIDLDFPSVKAVPFPGDVRRSRPKTISIISSKSRGSTHYYACVAFRCTIKCCTSMKILDVGAGRWLDQGFRVRGRFIPYTTLSAEGEVQLRKGFDYGAQNILKDIRGADLIVYTGLSTGKKLLRPGVSSSQESAALEEMAELDQRCCDLLEREILQGNGSLFKERVTALEERVTAICKQRASLANSLYYYPDAWALIGYSLDTNSWSLKNVPPPGYDWTDGSHCRVVWKDPQSNRVFMAASFVLDPNTGSRIPCDEFHSSFRGDPPTQIGFGVWQLESHKDQVDPSSDCYNWVHITSTPSDKLGAEFEVKSPLNNFADVELDQRDLYFAASGSVVCMAVVDHLPEYGSHPRFNNLPYGKYSRILLCDIDEMDDEKKWLRLPSPPIPPPSACRCWSGYVPAFVFNRK